MITPDTSLDLSLGLEQNNLLNNAFLINNETDDEYNQPIDIVENILDGLCYETEKISIGNKIIRNFEFNTKNGIFSANFYSFIDNINFEEVDIIIHTSFLYNNDNINIISIDDYFFVCYDNGRDASSKLSLFNSC